MIDIVPWRHGRPIAALSRVCRAIVFMQRRASPKRLTAGLNACRRREWREDKEEREDQEVRVGPVGAVDTPLNGRAFQRLLRRDFFFLSHTSPLRIFLVARSDDVRRAGMLCGTEAVKTASEGWRGPMPAMPAFHLSEAS